jgi:hypothetical protein
MPYEITIRDPKTLSGKPGEHEVVFTRHWGSDATTNDVVSLTDDELMGLFHAIGRRLDIDWHA